MARRYEEMCKTSPETRRAVIAAQAAAEVMGIQIGSLRTKSRRQNLVDARARIMAFAKVVAKSASFSAIGRTVNRGHVCAMRAFRQYGEEIATAVGVEHEHRE